MLFKKYISNLFLELKLTIKSLFSVCLVVFFSFVVIIPVINYSKFKLLGMTDDLYISIIGTARKIIPFISALPLVFYLRNYMECKGNELLLLYNKNKKIVISALLSFISLAFCAMLFSVYGYYFDKILIEFFRTCNLILLFSSIAYFLISLFKSTAISLLAMFTYEIFVVSSMESSKWNFVCWNFSEKNYFLVSFFVSLTLLILGELISRYRISYN